MHLQGILEYGEPGSQGFTFPSTSIVTRRGVFIYRWFRCPEPDHLGKIRNLSITILNQGEKTITPSLVVNAFEEGEDMTQNSRKFDMDDMIGKGEHVNMTMGDAVSFGGTGERIIRVNLYEGKHTKIFLASVETKIKESLWRYDKDLWTSSFFSLKSLLRNLAL